MSRANLCLFQLPVCRRWVGCDRKPGKVRVGERYLLIRAAFKYMEDLRALWAPNQPSRDAQGRLVTETFPRPEAVGKQVIVTGR
jgi:hypothetical protein